MVPPRASPTSRPEIVNIGISGLLKEHLIRKAEEKQLPLAAFIRLTLIEATGFVIQEKEK